MSIVTATICECDQCGHRWLPRKPGLPRRCARCKTWLWCKQLRDENEARTVKENDEIRHRLATDTAYRKRISGWARKMAKRGVMLRRRRQRAAAANQGGRN